MNQIDSKLVENICENLIGILPIIHRKLINILDEGIELELSHYHFAILGILSKFGELPVSKIGRRLLRSKPQMTAILDKLVDLGLVSRSQGSQDRRIVYISLTPQGGQILAKALATLNKNMAVKLANLSEADLFSFTAALKTVKEVGAKIE
jgi:MarR family transcriptional regulator, organic hydroperoxide resistance regulator